MPIHEISKELVAGVLSSMPTLPVLNLADNEIREVGEHLAQLTSLTRLSLTNNRLHRLDHLDTLVGLIEVRAADNHIVSVDLAGLPALKILDLANNHLCSLADIRAPTHTITRLNVACNPLSADPAHTEEVLAIFTNLARLDGVRLRRQGISPTASFGEEPKSASTALPRPRPPGLSPFDGGRTAPRQLPDSPSRPQILPHACEVCEREVGRAEAEVELRRLKEIETEHTTEKEKRAETEAEVKRLRDVEAECGKERGKRAEAEAEVKRLRDVEAEYRKEKERWGRQEAELRRLQNSEHVFLAMRGPMEEELRRLRASEEKLLEERERWQDRQRSAATLCGGTCAECEAEREVAEELRTQVQGLSSLVGPQKSANVTRVRDLEKELFETQSVLADLVQDMGITMQELYTAKERISSFTESADSN
eukprot:CAMPEP_0206239890 /NCGR_PEP_ID=MMETSP0047_2-20121206/15637_1 /ASSEMBLY_ACC=CAM_ASM_000192 /TAXON_ID=195065 /ORGANISM="Chroomonas mesostigmatica_cf, Strain CCMP1168" /LENGTH=423 /DNA_ID=CAMNT_0053664617 /DNA_START=166 /DNA_END=1434 /DNA_ORIENTATION=-